MSKTVLLLPHLLLGLVASLWWGILCPLADRTANFWDSLRLEGVRLGMTRAEAMECFEGWGDTVPEGGPIELSAYRSRIEFDRDNRVQRVTGHILTQDNSTLLDFDSTCRRPGEFPGGLGLTPDGSDYYRIFIGPDQVLLVAIVGPLQRVKGMHLFTRPAFDNLSLRRLPPPQV